jgi:predicted protein tyrosine phosphatase
MNESARSPATAIVVCPLSKVDEMVALHRPRHVISMLDPAWSFPELGANYTDRHLRLVFHDIHEAMDGYGAPAAEHVRELIRFMRAAAPDGPLLIHCRAGISRSTAAAFVAACIAHPDRDEHDLAVTLRRSSPLARPNEMLVELADREMGRRGRMSAAIASTGRGLPWIEVSENVPFRMLLD